MTGSQLVIEGELVMHEIGSEHNGIEIDNDSLEDLLDALPIRHIVPSERGKYGYEELHYGRCRIIIKLLPSRCNHEAVFEIDGVSQPSVKCSLTIGHEEWHQHNNAEGKPMFIWKGEKCDADISTAQIIELGRTQ